MKGVTLLKVKKDVTKEIKKRDPDNKAPKLTKVALIDLIPNKNRERIIDTAKMLDSGPGMLGADYDENSYKKWIKRLAIDYFRKQRGAKPTY